MQQTASEQIQAVVSMSSELTEVHALCGLNESEMIDYFQTLYSKNGESCAWKQIVVVILCSVNVVFCNGQVGLAHRTLLKGVLVRLAKSCVRRCFGNGQRNCGVGLDNL